MFALCRFIGYPSLPPPILYIHYLYLPPSAFCIRLDLFSVFFLHLLSGSAFICFLYSSRSVICILLHLHSGSAFICFLYLPPSANYFCIYLLSVFATICYLILVNLHSSICYLYLRRSAICICLHLISEDASINYLCLTPSAI